MFQNEHLIFSPSFLCKAFTRQFYISALKLLPLKDTTSLCHKSRLDFDKTSDTLPGKTISFDEERKISNENSAVDKEVVKRETKIQCLKRT